MIGDIAAHHQFGTSAFDSAYAKPLIQNHKRLTAKMDTKTAEETHPYLFHSDQGIDRRVCKRTVPMQVLSLDMSRTGTAPL
ncbi:hypothetical protein LSUE1_G003579 [Lachnellula suecica]|uniref:Uncharacterized protein n=1 Tax=Lachnellula suecica TaxID=602035 RepID=A0A8T9C5N3_9HELO|nr:hypothetical protein LSUE1_G003579 [Lachnellula suecica]